MLNFDIRMDQPLAHSHCFTLGKMEKKLNRLNLHANSGNE